MTNDAQIAALLPLLLEHDTFLVTSHERPDGDAIGSALGLMHLLDALGKQTTVDFTDRIPASFKMLPGVERITCELPQNVDAAILLECSSVERSSLPKAAYAALNPALTINIDHHLSGRNFANFNWIDPGACAVGAMIYDVVVAAGVTITPAMATCLYLAVLTDTGSFHYSSTTAGTFALAQHLVESGANPYRIAQSVFCSNPPSRVRLLASALIKLQLEGPIALTTITLAEMQQTEATMEDTEGIVNHLISIAEIEVAAFVREVVSGSQYRVSLRSKGRVDVARVCEQFGGGGHHSASGCTLNCTLDEATEQLLTALRIAASTTVVPAG
jgi:phosphoesterase RecJ-like protein